MQYVSISICVHKHITYYFRVEIWIFSRFRWPACGTDVKVLRLLPTRYGLMWKESVNALPKVVGFLSLRSLIANSHRLTRWRQTRRQIISSLTCLSLLVYQNPVAKEKFDTKLDTIEYHAPGHLISFCEQSLMTLIWVISDTVGINIPACFHCFAFEILFYLYFRWLLGNCLQLLPLQVHIVLIIKLSVIVWY